MAVRSRELGCCQGPFSSEFAKWWRQCVFQENEVYTQKEATEVEKKQQITHTHTHTHTHINRVCVWEKERGEGGREGLGEWVPNSVYSWDIATSSCALDFQFFFNLHKVL